MTPRPPMDVHSALTTVGTLLLLAALAVGVYVWLAYARWSELRFRGRGERLRSLEVLGTLRRGEDQASEPARRSFVRGLVSFAALLLVAVALLELRERL